MINKDGSLKALYAGVKLIIHEDNLHLQLGQKLMKKHGQRETDISYLLTAT